MNIKNKSLLINKCYVNGAWVSSDKKIKVINPASGDLIAEVPNFGKKETINAIDAAELAFKSWSKFTAHERSKILKKWYDLVIDNQSISYSMEYIQILTPFIEVIHHPITMDFKHELETNNNLI